MVWLTAHLGHALRGKTAGAFGPDLAKKLSQLVKMEKNVMRSLETVAKERMEVAVRRHLFRLQPTTIVFLADIDISNNSLSGARPATRTSQMSPTSLVSYCTRLASLKTNTWIATTSTE